jgi:hypothetical protein
MIKKSLSIAFTMCVAYEILLRNTVIPWDTSQNDKSANIISAQNFLFNYSGVEMAADTVIVGTSVSRKLILDSLGKQFINLAFNAWGTYDGLELLKLSGHKPACIMVETNYMKNQLLEPEIKSNLEPISYYSGKYVKCLQLRNQPVGLLIGWGKNLMKTRIDQLKEKKRTNVGLYQFNLQMNRNLMNQPIPDSVLNKRFLILKSLIEGFRNENIGIVFYEVPFDKELERTASTLAIREYYGKYFPPSEFKYISQPPSADNYIYSDGVHLGLQSALDYTLYLKNELNTLNTQ